MDFRVIIVIVASDPKNATTIPDKKAEAAHRIIVEAKDGFVGQLQVHPNVEVKSKLFHSFRLFRTTKVQRQKSQRFDCQRQ